MVIGSSLQDELAAWVRRALLPQKFPVRRELEIEAGVCGSASHVSFYDHFWVDQHILVAAAVHIRHGGLETALAASAFRQLLRALLVKIETLETVLAELAKLGGMANFDAALLRLDVISGATTAAARGTAAVRHAGTRRSLSPQCLPGDLIWLTAGELADLKDGFLPLGGLRQLLEPALDGSHAGAGCAVLYKSAAHSDRTATFMVANEQSEIPPLMEKVSAFLSKLALNDDAVAGIDVALDELLTNSVHYGFRDGNHHEILVSLTVAPDRIVIELQDDGTPFDPLSIPEPDLTADVEDRQIGGLGMHFVRSLLDSVHYKRSNGWNVLTLEKQLKAGEEDQT